MHERTRAGAWAATCLALLALGCYQRTERLPAVDEDARPSATDRPALTLCVVPTRLPRESVLRYGPVADRLSANTDHRVVLKPAATWLVALDRLRAGDADLAILGAGAAVRARRLLGTVPLARLEEESGTVYRAAIVVREDDAAGEIGDLRGRSLGLVGPESTTGQLLPLAGLAEAGLAPGDLAELRYFGRQDLVARAVQLGHVDAGAIRDSVADRYARRGLRTLWTSDPVPGPVVVAAPGLPIPVRIAIRDALIGAGEGILPGGERIDSSVRLRFHPIREVDDAAVETLLARVYGARAFDADIGIAGARRR